MKPDNRKNLVLTRRVGETIDIFFGDEKVSVTVLDKSVTAMGGGNQVRIAILANAAVRILRAEKCPYVEARPKDLGLCAGCDDPAKHYYQGKWWCTACKSTLETQ